VKLIMCYNCNDIVNLINEERFCLCGKSSGKYVDDSNAWYHGEATPLGISNYSITEAIFNQPKQGAGEEFKAFVIPKDCRTFKKNSKIKTGDVVYIRKWGVLYKTLVTKILNSGNIFINGFGIFDGVNKTTFFDTWIVDTTPSVIDEYIAQCDRMEKK